MFLERLEIQGFKSFARKVTFQFSTGVTAIVGPNGSGKSNVADAIRWVLGEQSLKQIRGKKSEDIIFAGSEGRARLGFAEVVLVFNNADHAMPIAYDSVEITRRVYRDGTSEYVLNGAKVRLMDIHELLAKAGFAQRSYGVISQGMIAELVTATPQERLTLFEDASGVTQFKLKREQALGKLATSGENAAKVQSILTEIEPHLQLLRRQAARAEKRAVVAHELAEKQVAYFTLAWEDVTTKTLEKSAQLEAINTQVAQAKVTLEQTQAAADTLRAQEDLFQTRLADLQQQAHDAQTRVTNQEAELTRLEAQIEIERSRKEQSTLATAEEQLAHAQEQIAATRAQQQLAQKQSELFHKQITEDRRALARIQNHKAEVLARLEKLRADAAQLSHPELSGRIKDVYLQHNTFLSKLSTTRSYDELTSLYSTASVVNDELRTLVRWSQGETPAPTEISLSSEYAERTRRADAAAARIAAIVADLTTQESRVQDAIRQTEIQIGVTAAALATAERELRAHERTRAALVTKRDEAARLLGPAAAAHLAQLESRAAEIRAAQEAARVAEKSARDRVTAERTTHTSARAQLAQAASEIRELQRSHARLKELAYAVRLEHDRLIFVRDQLHARMCDELTIDVLAQLLKLETVSEKMPIADREIDDLATDVHALESQLARIGMVDVAVLDECRAAEERYAFLSQQYADLTQASADLTKVIAELNAQIDEVFRSSFAQINERFQHFFTKLFRGGSAELTIESADRAVLGVGILATPPGKRLKNLAVLSGGEKALTSIALLCALLSINHSPFVVLDEADAALDEANAARFADIMGELSATSQFIVITHNRQTMRIASALYGVTMQKDGISQLLSIKFSDAPDASAKPAAPAQEPASDFVSAAEAFSLPTSAPKKSHSRRKTPQSHAVAAQAKAEV